MSLTRSDLLIINTTVLAGVLILLTLSNITFNQNILTINEDEESDPLKNLFQPLLVLQVILAIIPFALSSAIELYHETLLRRFEIKEKLNTELEKAEENKNMELIKEIKKRKNWYNKYFKPTSKQILEKNLYQRDEPSNWGVGITMVGFIYLIAAVLLIVIVNSI